MQRRSNIPRGFYQGLSILFFLILLGRLAQLQLFDRERYVRASEQNRVRDVVLEAPRGLIYDRFGEVLVDNYPSYSVSVVPFEFLKSDTTVRLLADILRQPEKAIVKKVRKEKVGNFSPVKLKRQIGFRELSLLEESRLELPGVFHNLGSKRVYPAGVRAPHLFGYLGEITSAELDTLKPFGYRLGDTMGKNGVEVSYEPELRGIDGVKYVEVDVLGREIRNLTELGGRAPVPGNDIYLTIDAEIQRYLEEALAGRRGAAVVLDPRNGDVLALLSKPDFDPEVFSNPLTPEIWNDLVNNEENPLYNRACQSLYPPGSTYKLIVAAAGLETGVMDLEERITCMGTFRLGRRDFACWREEGHGSVNFTEAIERSCNVYFYTKGLELGLEQWAKYSRHFFFGERTGIDLPNESPGLVPDREYFDSRYGEKRWTRGLLVNLSVGQGDLLVTPLQMASLAMSIGNEGVAFQPRLLSKVVDSITSEERYPAPSSKSVTRVSGETFARLKEGMYRVVNSGHGTGRAARVVGMAVCGKTGTAQNPHGDSHAWFIGFAPRSNPEVAFSIMVENGGGGGAVAAPIAGGLLRLLNKRSRVASVEGGDDAQ